MPTYIELGLIDLAPLRVGCFRVLLSPLLQGVDHFGHSLIQIFVNNVRR
jgi:hypothetical protein